MVRVYCIFKFISSSHNTVYIGSIMNCDGLWYLSNKLCVFWPNAQITWSRGKGKKSLSELDKNHVQSQTMILFITHYIHASFVYPYYTTVERRLQRLISIWRAYTNLYRTLLWTPLIFSSSELGKLSILNKTTSDLIYVLMEYRHRKSLWYAMYVITKHEKIL